MPLATSLRRWRAALAFLYLGVAPDGVYIDLVCHHTSGKLLPHLFTLTSYEAVIFCCTFLKVSLTGRYPASLLYGARTFLIWTLASFIRDCLIYSIYYFKLFLVYCQEINTVLHLILLLSPCCHLLLLCFFLLLHIFYI